VVCTEHYQKWPPLNFYGSQKLSLNSSPQFFITAKRSILDVAKLQYSSISPNFFGIVFEEDEGKPSENWQFFSGGVEEKGKVFEKITKIWMKKFKVPLAQEHIVVV